MHTLLMEAGGMGLGGGWGGLLQVPFTVTVQCPLRWNTNYYGEILFKVQDHSFLVYFTCLVTAVHLF